MTQDSHIMELRNVSVRYKTHRAFFRHDYFTALDDIHLDIEKGETLGVIGPNGCGKSTLLRVLANIYGIDTGTIAWNCEHVALLSLALGFDAELSGRDNAIISGMMLGRRKQHLLKMLDEIIEFSELEEFIDKPIKTYSSGMRARLGFSVAVETQTKKLLIDEVLGVGDRNFKRKAESAMVNKINSDQTVVLVSHSLEQIERLCQRVLLLKAGKIKMIGDPQDVLSEYKQFTTNGKT